MASPTKIRQRKAMGALPRTDSYDRDDEDHVDALYRSPVRTAAWVPAVLPNHVSL